MVKKAKTCGMGKQKHEIVKQEENVKWSEKAENVQYMKRKTIPYWG